jgi:hypothetical protein
MFANPLNDTYNDIIYFKSLYPDSISNIYNMVSDQCDKLEYDKSIMYDEYPDKERIRLIAANIYNSLAAPSLYDRPVPLSCEPEFCCPLIELIEVLLLNEFIHRRIRRRNFQ